MEKTTTAAVAAQDINNTLWHLKSHEVLFFRYCIGLLSLRILGRNGRVRSISLRKFLYPALGTGWTAAFWLPDSYWWLLTLWSQEKSVNGTFFFPRSCITWDCAKRALEILGGRLTFFFSIYHSNAGTGAIFF